MNNNTVIYKNKTFDFCKTYDCTPKGNELIMNDEELRKKSGVYLLDNSYLHMKKIMSEQEQLKNDRNDDDEQIYLQEQHIEGFQNPVAKIESKICFENEIELQPDQIQQYQMNPYKFQLSNLPNTPNKYLVPQFEQSGKQANIGMYRQYPQEVINQPILPLNLRRKKQKRVLLPSPETPIEQNAPYRRSRYPNYLEQAPNYIQPSQMIRQSSMGTLQNPPLPSQWNPLSNDASIYRAQVKDDIKKTIQYDRTNDQKFLQNKQRTGSMNTPVATQLRDMQTSPRDLANKSINPVSKTFNQKQSQTAQQIQQSLSSTPTTFSASRLDGSNPTTTLPQTKIEKFANYNSNADIISVETRCQNNRNNLKNEIINQRMDNPNIAYHSMMELPNSTFLPNSKEDICLKKFDDYAKDSDLILKNRALRRKAGMDNLNREMCLLDFNFEESPRIPQ